MNSETCRIRSVSMRLTMSCNRSVSTTRRDMRRPVGLRAKKERDWLSRWP